MKRDHPFLKVFRPSSHCWGKRRGIRKERNNASNKFAVGGSARCLLSPRRLFGRGYQSGDVQRRGTELDRAARQRRRLDGYGHWNGNGRWNGRRNRRWAPGGGGGPGRRR